MCSKAAATRGMLLSNRSLAVQSIKSHTLGQRDREECVSSPHGVRRSAKTETSKMQATHWGGWETPVQLHLIA